MGLMSLQDVRIGIVGLGYVGLPLAVYMARHFPVLGFDIDAGRIAELRAGKDRTMPGSGLGLAIVRQAADSHGGVARAENADGGGAVVSVSFGASLRPTELPETAPQN